MKRLFYFIALSFIALPFSPVCRAETALIPYAQVENQAGTPDVWGLSGSRWDGTRFFLANGLRQENKLLNSGFGMLAEDGPASVEETEINHRFKVHRAIAVSA